MNIPQILNDSWLNDPQIMNDQNIIERKPPIKYSSSEELLDIIKRICCQEPDYISDKISSFIMYGMDNDKMNFYIEVHKTSNYIEMYHKRVDALTLFSLHLPEGFQRKGLGTKIFDALEVIASEDNRVMTVTSVIEEPMIKFLMKRGYKQYTFLHWTQPI